MHYFYFETIFKHTKTRKTHQDVKDKKINRNNVPAIDAYCKRALILLLMLEEYLPFKAKVCFLSVNSLQVGLFFSVFSSD